MVLLVHLLVVPALRSTMMHLSAAIVVVPVMLGVSVILVLVARVLVLLGVVHVVLVIVGVAVIVVLDSHATPSCFATVAAITAVM